MMHVSARYEVSMIKAVTGTAVHRCNNDANNNDNDGQSMFA